MNADVNENSTSAGNSLTVDNHKKVLMGDTVIGVIKAVGLNTKGLHTMGLDYSHEVTVEIKYDFDKKDIVCGSCKGICDHAMTFRVLMGEKLEDILIKAVFKKGKEQFKKGEERP